MNSIHIILFLTQHSENPSKRTMVQLVQAQYCLQISVSVNYSSMNIYQDVIPSLDFSDTDKPLKLHSWF